jgi:hypothetical protein
MIAARDAVIAELERIGFERYKPRILLVDTKNKSHICMIHVMQEEKYMYDEQGNSRNRTYYVHNGTIIGEEIGERRRDD